MTATMEMDKDTAELIDRLKAVAGIQTLPDTADICRRPREECGRRPSKLPADWTRAREIEERTQQDFRRIGALLADTIEAVDRMSARLDKL
jgi:hypothetical protein